MEWASPGWSDQQLMGWIPVLSCYSPFLGEAEAASRNSLFCPTSKHLPLLLPRSQSEHWALARDEEDVALLFSRMEQLYQASA